MPDATQGPQTEPLPDAPNERLAYAVASALGNPDVRQSVHAAMDASPYVEHKLVFQEFLESPQGSALKAAVSKVLGGEQQLTALLAEFPTLDFYLPFETLRKTWEHANSNLWVVCEIDPNATEAMAYHPDGSHEWLTSRQEILEAEIAALFTLHRAEPKMQRDSATTVTTHFIQASSTSISEILNFSADGVAGGNCEFYFQSDSDDGGDYTTGEVSVQSVAYSIFNAAPIPGLKVLDPLLLVYAGSPSASNTVYISMWEADGFLTGDDDYMGAFQFTSEGTFDTDKTSASYTKVPTARVTIVVN